MYLLRQRQGNSSRESRSSDPSTSLFFIIGHLIINVHLNSIMKEIREEKESVPHPQNHQQ